MTRPFALALFLTVAGCAMEPPTQDLHKSAEVNAELGVGYMMKGNFALALEKLQKALAYDAQSVAANHYAGELYRRLGRADEADRYFRAALAHGSKDPALRNNYGVFLCEQGRIAEAEEQFKVALDDPVYTGRAMVYENLGVCARRKPDLEEAQSYFRKALALSPRQPQSLLAMAELSFESGGYLSARGYLQRFEEVAQHGAASLWLAVRTEQRLGDPARAMAYAQRLRREFPDSEETKRYLESVQP